MHFLEIEQCLALWQEVSAKKGIYANYVCISVNFITIVQPDFSKECSWWRFSNRTKFEIEPEIHWLCPLDKVQPHFVSLVDFSKDQALVCELYFLDIAFNILLFLHVASSFFNKCTGASLPKAMILSLSTRQMVLDTVCVFHCCFYGKCYNLVVLRRVIFA